MKTQQLAELGLREQNKLEKRQRIQAAARELFSKHGYETATLRQIATLAHVGLGTLFNYVQDKRDLIFLIFNKELENVIDEALKSAQAQESLLEQLLGLFRPHYKFFAKDPTLSRILLKDMIFYSDGKQAAEFQRIRGRLLSGIEKVVGAAQREQQIKSDEETAIIARNIFLVFAGELRWWIASVKPDAREGLLQLRRFLELQISGLHPSRGRIGGAVRKGRQHAANRQRSGGSAHKDKR